MKVVATIFALVGSFMLGACATAPGTFSNSDLNADFIQYKTWGYFETLSTD